MQKTEEIQIQKQIKMILSVTLFMGVFYMWDMWAPIMMPEALCTLCCHEKAQTWYFYDIWIVQLVIAIMMYCSRNMFKQNAKKFSVWISILAMMYFVVALIPAGLHTCYTVMNGHDIESMLDLECQATIMLWGAVIDLGMTLVCGSIMTKTICLYGKQLKLMIRSALVICVIVVAVMILGDYEFSSARNRLGNNEQITRVAKMGWLCYVQAGITLVMCCTMMNISKKKCAVIGMVIAGINIIFALFHYGMFFEPELRFDADKVLGTYPFLSYHYKPDEKNEMIAKMLNLVLVELSGLVIVWCKNYLENKWGNLNETSSVEIQDTGEKCIPSKKLVKSATLISIVQMISCIVIILGMIYLFQINKELAYETWCEECDIESTTIIEYRVAAIAAIVQLVAAIRIVLAVLKDKWNKHCEPVQLLQSCKINSIIGAISMLILAIMAVIAPMGKVICFVYPNWHYTYVKEAKIIIGIISVILLCLNVVILHLTNRKKGKIR